MTPTILIREGMLGKNPWRQYMVITDGCVVVVHMTPALIAGWNFQRKDRQDGDAWPNMTRDQIVAWKLRHDDLARVFESPIDSGFRARLLAYANG